MIYLKLYTDNTAAPVRRRHDRLQLPRPARRAAAQRARPAARNHERHLCAVQEGQGGEGLDGRHFGLGGARPAAGRVQGRTTKLRCRREIIQHCSPVLQISTILILLTLEMEPQL